uniref:Uncharacterized protein n=1 Tax=Arundo donax TaxID=35708 RepID=A0A0A8ZEE5_ARUDO
MSLIFTLHSCEAHDNKEPNVVQKNH